MQKLQIKFLDTNQSELGYFIEKKWYQEDINNQWQIQTELIATIQKVDGVFSISGSAFESTISSEANPENDQTEIYKFEYIESEKRFFVYSVLAFNSNGNSPSASSPFFAVNDPIIVPTPLGGTTTAEPTTPDPDGTTPFATSTTSEPIIPTPYPTTPRPSLPAHVYITYDGYFDYYANQEGDLKNYYPSYESQGWTYGNPVNYFNRSTDLSWENELANRGMRYRLNGNSTYDPIIQETFYHFETYEDGDPPWEIKWRANVDMGNGAFDPRGAWVIGFGGDVYTSMNYTGAIYPNSPEHDSNSLGRELIQMPWIFAIINPANFHFQEGAESLTQGFSELGVSFP